MHGIMAPTQASQTRSTLDSAPQEQSADRWEISKYAIWSALDGELVILHSENGIYFGLNRAGSIIWRMVSEKKTTLEIVAALQSEYDVDEATAGREVRELVDELCRKDLLVAKRQEA